mmetsp:Transcript_78782/g.122983  ORF Transcript_78782/g.122983 Transcript_78782/m.122983 type:complete len:293 (-) Transcript_78782:74-952(-)
MLLAAFVLNCITVTSHGRRSQGLHESVSGLIISDHTSDRRSLTVFLLRSQSQKETSYSGRVRATSLLALDPSAVVRPVVTRDHGYRRACSNRQLQPCMIVKTRRPTEGDVVVIKSTPNTRQYCPALIGTRSTILVDAADAQPYQVKSADCWFHEEDVELTGQQEDMMEGIVAREVTKLANSDELRAKIEEAAREDKALVVAFFASWCRACKATKPKFMKITKEWPQVEFCEILFDDNKELAKKKGIKSLPFFELYTGDKERVDAFQCGPSKIKKLDDTLKDRLLGRLSGFDV